MKILIKKTRKTGDFKKAAAMMSVSDPWMKLGIDYKHCLANIKAPYHELYAAFEGEEIKGLSLINMYGTLRGYIKALWVSPDQRNRGLGRKLIKYSEKRIFRDSKNVFLCVSSFNKNAIRFYKEMGYIKTGVFKDFIVKGHDEYLMRKTKGLLRPG